MRCRQPRKLLTRPGLTLLVSGLWATGSAQGHDTNYIWPVSYGESRLELDYRWVDRAALAEARYELGQAYLIGDPAQIRDWILKVKRLKQGLSVDIARCLGRGEGVGARWPPLPPPLPLPARDEPTTT